MNEPDILFEDSDLIFLNKPSGVSVEWFEPGDESLQSFVAKRVGRGIKIKHGPGIVHRLDKPTSGVVVMAKKPKILKTLNAIFAERKVIKRYLAETDGIIAGSGGKLTHILIKDNIARKAVVADIEDRRHQDAKEAVLSYEVLEVRRNSASTLLEIKLETGRYHQIRAQLASIGHPVMGDEKYGSKVCSDRIHLHCFSLELHHPKTNELLSITAPAPF
ncbi:MAG: RluA family pseudouridine synthase [Balneolales bacterium]|nr:RluA family pseudouridine synthase [Balneolales bacterium]